ncbi:hypothetical protein [Candidatus Protochlamydia amoebophila]|uniref:Uncharacterized protein n=1 Tax=Candidatus Protochlamydia amoebophila TaxID=362787 RepID=A0A0C1K1J1_9BACT|nr:hypothetical protein [Candidatus Protochlamydia amoebophila]KIC73282.1 hypothetical protein DB44_BH00050 [Candidatus Protochlamydia amoebophila]
MKKWFIADTHFSHVNISKYANRLFARLEKMKRSLLKIGINALRKGIKFSF